MKSAKILTILVMALVLVVCQAKVSEAAEPMGTAFTYQGHLYDANYAANGQYDFQFKLYDASIGGSQVGGDINKPDVDVIDADFTVELDFGSGVFNGNAVWLEIGVRPGGLSDPNGYTTLSPRQEVTPTPYALHTRGIFVDNTGDVGIGTDSPGAKLEVSGQIKITGGSPGAGKVLTSDADGLASWQPAPSGGDNDWMIWGDDMYAIPPGNVGIGTTSPSSRLEVVGTVHSTSGGFKFPDGTTQTSALALPSGVIVMWSGLIASIPSGWALCDGNNGTPDLTSRFIRSVPNASTNPGSTGGSATHSHGAGTYTGPSHTHTLATQPGGQSNSDIDNRIVIDSEGGVFGFTSNGGSGNLRPTATTNSGGTGAITGTSALASSLPSYYELAFIMKL